MVRVRVLTSRERAILNHMVAHQVQDETTKELRMVDGADKWWNDAQAHGVVRAEEALAAKVARHAPSYDASVKVGGHKSRADRENTDPNSHVSTFNRRLKG